MSTTNRELRALPGGRRMPAALQEGLQDRLVAPAAGPADAPTCGHEPACEPCPLCGLARCQSAKTRHYTLEVVHRPQGAVMRCGVADLSDDQWQPTPEGAAVYAAWKAEHPEAAAAVEAWARQAVDAAMARKYGSRPSVPPDDLPPAA